MRVPAMTLNSLIRVLAVAACVAMAAVAPNVGAAQTPGAVQAAPAAPGAAAQAPGRGRGPQPVDPRVQIRMHHFAETNQEIPYSLFVSSKVKKNKKAPLIVTLHGIGGTHLTMMRPNAIDLAEAGGYILLAPMGYNRAAGTARRRREGAAAHHRRRPSTLLAAPGAMVEPRGLLRHRRRNDAAPCLRVC